MPQHLSEYTRSKRFSVGLFEANFCPIGLEVFLTPDLIEAGFAADFVESSFLTLFITDIFYNNCLFAKE